MSVLQDTLSHRVVDEIMVGYRCTYQSRLKTVRSGDRHMTAGRINRGVLCVYRSHSPSNPAESRPRFACLSNISVICCRHRAVYRKIPDLYD